MRKIYLKNLLFLIIFLKVITVKAVCGFSVDKTTVCSGEEITIILDKPLSTYHKIIVSKGTFPFLSAANANDYYVVAPYTENDNIVKIVFRGRNTAQDYTIQLAESILPNPVIPCNKNVSIRVNPTPDPALTEASDFSYCNEKTSRTITVTNSSLTKNTNSSYEIDWGDGSPVFTASSFNDETHTYPVGDYIIKYKVTGSNPGSACNVSEKAYYVKIGGISPKISFLPSTQTSFCAPGYYEIYPDIAIMNQNTPNTTYKFYANDELIKTYKQDELPTVLNYYFEEGSCSKSSPKCGQSSVSFYMEAYSGNCPPAILNTCVFITDSLKPYIVGKDLVCQTETATYSNGNEQKDKYISGVDCKDPIYTWSILEPDGYTLKNGTSNKTFNVQFDSLGTYKIKVSLDASAGICQDKADTTFDVTVVEKVVIDFNTDPIVCIPNITGAFVDIPIEAKITQGDKSNIKSFSWTIIPDNTKPISVPNYQIISGNTSSQNMIVRFDAWRSYNIILNYETICEKNSISRTIRIASKGAFDSLPIPSICSYPATINPNDYFTFDPARINGGDNVVQYLWAFNGGTPNTQQTLNAQPVTYSNSGTYPVSLTVRNVCGDSTLSPNLILYNQPQPDAGKDTVLCGTSNPVTLTGNPSGGIWSGQGITDGILGIFDPKTVPAGDYTVYYTTYVSTSCPPVDSLVVTVLPTGISAGPDQSICKINGSGQPTLHLVSNPLFPGGSWSGTGVTSASGTFDPSSLAPGTYSVTYTYTDPVRGCKDVSNKNITVYPAININTTLPQLCVQQSFDFSFIGGNLIDANWDFGDGIGTANIPYPSYVYTSSGDFTITVKAEDANHCSDNFSIPVKVIGEQNYHFNINKETSCTGDDFIITFPADHDIAQHYKWDFDNHSIQSNLLIVPTLNLPKPSVNDTVYQIKLTTTYACTSYVEIKQLTVKADPVANMFLLSDNGCAPFSTQILNNSTGQIDSVRWLFGNGQTSTLLQPLKTPNYLNPNRTDTIYTITLIAHNICASDTIKKPITVKANQVYTAFTMSKNTGCIPLSVDFTSTVIGATNFVWHFNDAANSISFDNNPTFVFNEPGTFPVMLIAQGSCGADTITRNITAFDLPKADFEIKNACSNQLTQFQNKSTNANNYSWDLGLSGATSASINPNYKYTTDGVYAVRLIARNTNCSDTITKTINIQPSPTAKFSVVKPDICFSELASFNNESIGAFNYIWNFGDNTTSTDINPEHLYPNPANFNVMLVAKNQYCSDSVLLNNAIKVHPNPVADFTVQITDNDLRNPVLFINTSTNAIQYSWQFGDGNSSTEKNPEHSFAYNKGYKVMLIATSNKNCTDTIEKGININPSGTLFVPNIFTPNGTGENAFFTPKGNKLKEYHIQIFSTYGQLIWESTKITDGSPTDAWDGTFKGQPMPQDVYVWKIRAIFNNGTFWEGMEDISSGKKTTMGSLILLR